MSTFTKSHNWGTTKVIMTSVHIVLYYRKHTRLVIADRKRAGLNQFSRQLKQWYPITKGALYHGLIYEVQMSTSATV